MCQSDHWWRDHLECCNARGDWQTEIVNKDLSTYLPSCMSKWHIYPSDIEVYWEPELLYQAAIWLLMNVSILSPMDRSFGMLYCKRWLTSWKCQLRPIHNKQVAWQNWHICPSEIESCNTLAKSRDWVDSQPQSTHMLILLFLIGILVTLSFILRVYNFRLS